MVILIKIMLVTLFMFCVAVVCAILNGAINANDRRALDNNAVIILICVILSTSVLTVGVTQ